VVNQPYMGRPFLEVRSFEAVLPIRHIITAGYASKASPSKGRRIKQRVDENTSVCQIPFGIRTRVQFSGWLGSDSQLRRLGVGAA